MSEDFGEDFAAMVGKGEPEPAPGPEPAAPPEPEPERTPVQAHNDLLNELLAGKAQREQRLVDLLHEGRRGRVILRACVVCAKPSAESYCTEHKPKAWVTRPATNGQP